MSFWDSSALVAAVVPEQASERVQPLLRRDDDVILWWGTPVECESVLGRAKRQGRLDASRQKVARALLETVFERAVEIQPGDDLRLRAMRLLAAHSLRASDALQLAAALLWCRERTAGAGFVCLDDRLREAASREGFKVLPYSDEVNEP